MEKIIDILFKFIKCHAFVIMIFFIVTWTLNTQTMVSATLNCSQYSMNDNEGYWDAVKKVSICSLTHEIYCHYHYYH